MSIFDLNDARSRRWLALGLFIVTVLTRIPFTSQYLYHWDSVNMAFGMIHFNPVDGAPHFPGYFFYIVLGDIFNVLFGNANTTLVILSIVGTGAAVVALFYLGIEMFDATVGLIAAVLLMTSPLVWFYSEIALPHTLDMLCVIVAALLLYRIMKGETRLVWLAAVFFGVLCGFRYVSLVYLVPLIVFAGYQVGIKRIIGFGLIVAAIGVVWVIPTLNAAGGLATYMSASREFSNAFFTTTSVISGGGVFALKRNLVEKLIPYTAYAWGLAALPALYVLTQIPQWRTWIRSRKFWFMVLWVAPSIGFYVLIHMGQQGYVFSFLPACMLISAKGLTELFKSRPAVLKASAAALAVVGAVIFIVAPVYPLGENGPKLLTYATLREHDKLLGDQITAIRENFQPDDTLLVAANWRHIQYYMPEYQFARFDIGAKYEVAEGEATGADYVNEPVTAEAVGLQGGEDWQVVMVDEELKSFTTDELDAVTLPDGFEMSYLKADPEEVYWTDGQTFGVREAG